MYPHHVLTYLRLLLTREEGFTMSEVMWSLAVVAMIAGVAYVLGPLLGANWAEFVGEPTP